MLDGEIDNVHKEEQKIQEIFSGTFSHAVHTLLRASNQTDEHIVMITKDNSIDDRFLRMITNALDIRTKDDIQIFRDNFIACIREQVITKPRIVFQNIAIQEQDGEIILLFI